ncbi:MAG: cation:H+ antiporter [Pirellulaceae bacterium]|jgi:cation:H+ antiporter
MMIVSLEFLALAIVVALAGTYLARSADQIAEITRLGRLLVGSVLLAAATSLPELTVDFSAVRQGMPDLAAGDLFGSSLMNLLILAVLDLVHRSGGKMLSREAAAHALSATLSIALTAIAGMAMLTAPHLPGPSFLGIGIWSWGILVAYLLGVRMIFLDQRVSARAAVVAKPESSRSDTMTVLPPLWKPVVVFAVAALVLCLTGPRLAHTAGQLADLSGLGKTFVGTSLVALCTSLPELVASISALRLKAFDLVIGNVFGSNAFNMLLFLPLDAAHAGSLFADISSSHAVTALAVIVATAVATLGQLYHVEKRRRVFEPDALLMILILGGALVLVYQLSS